MTATAWSASGLPRAGQLVSCAGLYYRLTHQHEGRWWSAMLGSDRDNPRHTSFTWRVPVPFLLVREDA